MNIKDVEGNVPGLFKALSQKGFWRDWATP
jgi:hypothetical protein